MSGEIIMFSAGQLDRLKGCLKIKNVSGSILTLTEYGQYEFAVDEELNLLDEVVPNTLRAADYYTAQNMVGRASVGKAPSYTTYELAQKINAGQLAVIEDRLPDVSVLEERPE